MSRIGDWGMPKKMCTLHKFFESCFGESSSVLFSEHDISSELEHRTYFKYLIFIKIFDAKKFLNLANILSDTDLLLERAVIE